MGRWVIGDANVYKYEKLLDGYEVYVDDCLGGRTSHDMTINGEAIDDIVNISQTC